MKGHPKPVKIRKTWGNIKPVTKIKGSDKIYNRNKNKEVKDESVSTNDDMAEGINSLLRRNSFSNLGD